MGAIAVEHLERFSKDQAVEDISTARGYRAVVAETGSRRVPRLRVVYPDGKMSVLSYSYLQEILYSNHQNLSLIFTSSVITLEGRNLWGLLDHLQTDRARILQCYDAARFPEAPGEGEPVILSIKRQSLREFTAGAGATAERAQQKELASPPD